MSQTYKLIPLDSTQPAPLKSVGGKGYGLMRLASAGQPVPPGWIVPAEVPNDNVEALITAQLRPYQADYFAVRSSAVAEDSSDASWAGQLQTYLYVPATEVARRVLECRASGSSASAQAYADAHGVAPGQVAVVIQQMVPADISGVLFTANPVNGSLDEFVIEAIEGLGELLVSGEVTPETRIVSNTGKIIQHSPHAQTVRLDGHGGVLKKSHTSPPAHILAPEQVQLLCTAGRQITAAFKAPMDIEWVISQNRLYILQARPITTLTSR